jgi:hypothetical protein
MLCAVQSGVRVLAFFLMTTATSCPLNQLASYCGNFPRCRSLVLFTPRAICRDLAGGFDQLLDHGYSRKGLQ